MGSKTGMFVTRCETHKDVPPLNCQGTGVGGGRNYECAACAVETLQGENERLRTARKEKEVVVETRAIELLDAGCEIVQDSITNGGMGYENQTRLLKWHKAVASFLEARKK